MLVLRMGLASSQEETAAALNPRLTAPSTTQALHRERPSTDICVLPGCCQHPKAAAGHLPSPHKLLNRWLRPPLLLLLLLHLLLPRCCAAACRAPAAPPTPAASVAAVPAAAAAAGLRLWWGRHWPCGNIQLLSLLAKISLQAVNRTRSEGSKAECACVFGRRSCLKFLCGAAWCWDPTLLATGPAHVLPTA
jgi:hypothetical protein